MYALGPRETDPLPLPEWREHYLRFGGNLVNTKMRTDTEVLGGTTCVARPEVRRAWRNRTSATPIAYGSERATPILRAAPTRLAPRAAFTPRATLHGFAVPLALGWY